MINEELQNSAAQEREAQAQFNNHIFVCTGTACHSAGSGQVKDALENEIKERNLGKKCAITGGGCRGLCSKGPLVTVIARGGTDAEYWEQQYADTEHDVLYQEVKVDDVAEIIDSLDKEPVERLVCPPDIPFFAKQTKIALEYSGKLNPERIEDYIAAGGYAALSKALTEMTPAEVVDEIVASGLRGRGGAGYPTGLKWSTVAKARAGQKYVIVNGDEGDPGAFMDRSVMEDYPFKVLEGVTIAAYAVGADKGYLYVRAEYPLAIKRLQAAIRQAQRRNLLGNNIGGTPFSFQLEVRLGAGAFVCGEETALMASIEGRRGTPRPRPPYPAESGLWGNPTLINNVETYASIPLIIKSGSEWFSNIGTEKSKGTKVFSLTGRVSNIGLIEVAMGIPLREIVYDIGGGIPNGRRFKAVQTGGPSGGCIPEQFLDMPVDYESLAQVGSIMGSGGMIVMDETSCMVDVAKYFMEFSMTESCGKCVPCRVGTAQMHDLLEKICTGEATMADLEQLEMLCDMVRNTSLCGLGQAAPNPVISTLQYFRDEYLAHIVDKTCPAGVCPLHKPESMEVS
jgi:bidirectional [NiFe] hydrogenase diaphorase subunit